MEQKVYTVTELNESINTQLSALTVRVKGEISDFRVSGKFVYFDLKDDGSRINCFIMAFQLPQGVENGMEAIVTGSPGVYVPYGKYTFRVRLIELAGEGALRRAFELTKRKLEDEGLFLPEHKKALPRFPERIALVTSRDAAAYSDFMRILQNRWGGVEVSFMDVRVQGSDAVDEICEALAAFNMRSPAADVLVLARGGGSLEDLQAFNMERTARAVFASRIPVVVGVGHERDVTLCDLAADARASTPSNAAELVVPDRSSVAKELEALREALKVLLDRRCVVLRTRLAALVTRMDRALTARAERGRSLTARLAAAYDARMAQARGELLRLQSLLRALNPLGVLQRGYSVTRKNGKVVKDALAVQAGDRVETLLAKGRFMSVVDTR